MSIGGCPSCGSHPHHSIGCPIASGVVAMGPVLPTTKVATSLYPCDNGDPRSTTRGWHHFEAGPSRIICCTRCGARPLSASAEQPELP